MYEGRSYERSLAQIQLSYRGKARYVADFFIEPNASFSEIRLKAYAIMPPHSMSSSRLQCVRPGKEVAMKTIAVAAVIILKDGKVFATKH